MPVTDQMIIPPGGGNISILKADNRHVLAIERPQFTFEYLGMKFTKDAQEYWNLQNQLVAMTPEQVTEVSAFLSSVEPSPELSAKVAENYRNRKFLQDTDWYVIRQAETGVPVPQDILDLRSRARAAIHEL